MPDIPSDGKVATSAQESGKLHQEGLSAWTKYSNATIDGVISLPQGIGHALKEDFTTLPGL